MNYLDSCDYEKIAVFLAVGNIAEAIQFSLP